jgi:microcompartment protein CcmK/EutM
VLVPTGRVMLRRALGEALAAEDSARRGWAMAEGARALAEADLDVKRGRPGRISDELSGAETRIATHPGRLLAAVNFLSLTENQQSLVMDHAALLDRRDELIANAQRAADEIAAGEDEVVALTDRALAAREVYDAAKLAVDAVRIRAMNAED